MASLPPPPPPPPGSPQGAPPPPPAARPVVSSAPSPPYGTASAPTAPPTGGGLGQGSTVPAPPQAATCHRHPTRETWRSCTRCGRPACPDCLVQASVGSHCVDCVKAAQPPAREQLRRWNATAGAVLTQALIAVNVAVFVLGVATGSDAVGRGSGPLQRDYGVAAFYLDQGEWYRLVTAGFVHFGLVHLAFNMLVIFQLGRMLEPGLGRVRFLALYLACVVAGTAGAVVLEPGALSAGASTAAFGLAGAAAVGLRHRGISIMQSGLGMMLIINFVLTFSIPGISIGGHLGGFLGGVVVGGVLLRPRPDRTMGTGSMVGDLAVAAAVVAAGVVAAVLRVNAGWV